MVTAGESDFCKKCRHSPAKRTSAHTDRIENNRMAKVKKGYVERSRSEEDRRVVLVSLSEKGEKAYFHHRMFHEKMVMEVLDGMDKEETEVLTRALTKLQKFFRTYGNDK